MMRNELAKLIVMVFLLVAEQYTGGSHKNAI
jgi:hypothetical protein